MRTHPRSFDTFPTRAARMLRLLGTAMAAAIVGFAALTPAPAVAASGADGHLVSSTVRFRIVVPPMLRLHSRHQPQRLVITAQDVAAGFVDIDRAVEVDVQSNLRAFAVQLRLVNPLIKLAEVSGLADGAQVSDMPTSINIAQAAGRTAPTTLRLGFRLRLDARMAPGEYPWPVALTVTPV